MMLDSGPMRYLEAEETLREILQTATPRQLVVVLLRMDGYTDQEIGTLLGISRFAVGQRIYQLKCRIERAHPELGRLVMGRDKRRAANKAVNNGGEA